MSIDANVAYVELNEDGSGVIHLCDRGAENSRGQDRLRFDSAPHEVTSLNGLQIWGGGTQLMLGDRKIANRLGYTRISFIEREAFIDAIRLYRIRKRAS